MLITPSKRKLSLTRTTLRLLGPDGTDPTCELGASNSCLLPGGEKTQDDCPSISPKFPCDPPKHPPKPHQPGGK
ncbi:MAG TPA: hypothetical protein VFP84_07200 [Kofleriaceae bacterium]|nr:hypothetical protein [Kofleriaceae bacterium]